MNVCFCGSDPDQRKISMNKLNQHGLLAETERNTDPTSVRHSKHGPVFCSQVR